MFLKINRLWRRLSARIFTTLARGGFKAFGARSILIPPLRIGGEERVSIGSGVFLGANSWIQYMEGDDSANDQVIRIGDDVSIAGHCTITSCREVVIEDGVLIARYVYISDHSHEFGSSEIPIKDQGVKGVAPVRIMKGAWLGQGERSEVFSEMYLHFAPVHGFELLGVVENIGEVIE